MMLTALNSELANETQETHIEGMDLVQRPSKTKLSDRFTLKELMDHEFEPINWVVEGLLPAGLALLVGSPKSGKSWFVLDMALATSSGSDFLGHTLTQGAALYIALEDSGVRLQNRINKLSYNPSALSNLSFWTSADDNPDSLIANIETWRSSADAPRLVIIDTMGRITPERRGTTSEYQFYTKFLGRLQSYALENNLCILLVHHKNKGNLGELDDMFDAVHGSTGIQGVADTTLMLSRERLSSRATLNITGRDVDERQLSMLFDNTTGRWILATEDILSDVTPEKRNVILAVRDGASTPTDIAYATGSNRTTIQNHLKDLTNTGHLVKVGTGVYQLSENLELEFGQQETETTAHQDTFNPNISVTHAVIEDVPEQTYSTDPGLDEVEIIGGVPF